MGDASGAPAQGAGRTDRGALGRVAGPGLLMAALIVLAGFVVAVIVRAS